MESQNTKQKSSPQKPMIINIQQVYREVKGKWKSLYPAYFNSNKSLTQGRRVAKQLAIPDPTPQQIARACILCRINNIVQPHKSYSRDILEKGRLKVQVFDNQKKPLNPLITSKKKFLVQVAKKLKQVRTEKLKHQKLVEKDK